jgi:hypothetical protein
MKRKEGSGNGRSGRRKKRGEWRGRGGIRKRKYEEAEQQQ